MAAIISCPKCDKHVAVPDDASTDAEVRCPLCDEAFTLTDSMTEVPSLIVVDAAATDVPVSDDADGGGEIDFAFADESDADAASKAADGDEVSLDIESDDATGDIEFEVSESSDDEEDTVDFAAFMSDDEEKQETPGDAAALDLDLQADDADGVETSGIGFADLSDAEETVSDADSSGVDFGSFGESGGDDADAASMSSLGGFGDSESRDSSSATASKAAPPEKKKSRKLGPIAMIGGIVGFGMLGIILGYVILLWVKPASLHKFHSSMAFLDTVAAAIGPEGVVEAIYADPPPPPAAPVNNNPTGLPDIGSGLPAKGDTPPPADANDTGTSSSSHSYDKKPETSAPSNSFLNLYPSSPDYSLEELQKARKKVGNVVPRVRSAEGKARKKGLTKDERKAILKGPRGKLFVALSELAEISTFYSADLPQEVDAEMARTLTSLEEAVESRSRGMKVYGRQWIGHATRKPDETGLFLVGKVTSVSPSGDWKEVDLNVASSKSKEPQIVRLLVTAKTDVSEGASVAVLGSIADQEYVTLQGYDSGEQVIVLSRVVLPLE